MSYILIQKVLHYVRRELERALGDIRATSISQRVSKGPKKGERKNKQICSIKPPIDVVYMGLGEVRVGISKWNR